MCGSAIHLAYTPPLALPYIEPLTRGRDLPDNQSMPGCQSTPCALLFFCVFFLFFCFFTSEHGIVFSHYSYSQMLTDFGQYPVCDLA